MNHKSFANLIMDDKSYEEVLNIIENKTSIGHWSFDISSNKFYFSDTIYKIIHMTKNDNGMEYDDFCSRFLPSEKESFNLAFKNLIESKTSMLIKLKTALKDGEIRVIKFHSDIPKQTSRIIWGTFQDVTDYENLSDEYKKIKRKYFELFENALHGIYSSTVEGKVLVANSKFYEILGFPKESKNIPINLCKQGFVKIEQRAKLRKMISQNDMIPGFESKWKRIDGEMISIRENIRAKKNSNGKIIQYDGTIEDISEEIKIKKDLQYAKEKVEESDKIKTVFLSQISHEIRTPINSMLNYAELIKYSVNIEENEDIKMSINGMNRAGRRMIRTVDLIVNMAELLNGSYHFQYRKIDIYTDILKKYYMEYLSLANEKGITLSLEKKTEQTSIYSDEYSLSQIFCNLIDNAIKFTKNGAVRIVIEKNKSNRFAVTVNDTGIGITEKFLPHIFKPFSQEEEGYTRSFEGNGLGLALVEKYCELHKAYIEISSKKNEGTNFKITFPF